MCHLHCSLYLLALPKESLGYTMHAWVCHLKCSLCLLPLPKESLGYTVLTDVCLALSSKKKSYSLFRQKSRLVSPKNLTPYWAPKDVKSSFIHQKCFARFNKFGLHEFQCKGAKTYRHNYSIQTLSSNSWHVAWINQVNKAYDEKCSSNGLDK